MLDRRALIGLPLLFAAIAALSLALSGRASPDAPAPRPARTPLSPSHDAPPTHAGPIRWIVAGGGPTPDLDQVQLEQDVRLARDILSPLGPGLTLFAGGSGSEAVQVLDPALDVDPLRAELAALFAPRPGRDSRYRALAFHPDGAASAEALLAAIEGALTDGEGPLTVYLAGHGDGGEEPRESRFLTWGPDDLWVEDVATLLDGAPGHRPLRLVMTSCYSGGFAELAFAGADPEQGAATTDRCGLFATTWDRAASGCDPNPDRGAQEGYGIHFLHALRGDDREGRPLPSSEIDFDGDGVVSLLEAHTRARVASGSFDVPVTTSERFLRAAVDPETSPAPEHEAALPEERAVVAGLLPRLGLERAEDAERRLDAITREMESVGEELDRADSELAAAEETLASALLHRWPVLDDPWHPLFADVIARDHDAIARFLEESGEAARRDELTEERDRLADEHDRLLLEAAPLTRLARALETIALASRLEAEGGTYWLRYQALLACERGRP